MATARAVARRPSRWIVGDYAAMFVIALGPGNVDLSLPANIGLASAVAMKTMDGSDALIAVGLLAALACGAGGRSLNYLLIWALRIPPIIATLSASFIIHSLDISYGRGLQIKPPPGFADFTNLQVLGIPVLVDHYNPVHRRGRVNFSSSTVYGRLGPGHRPEHVGRHGSPGIAVGLRRGS